MTDSVWKKFERAVARFFGCERTGPMQGKDANDIDHHCLHVQCKHSQRHAIVSVWDAAKKVADKDGKIPVVVLKQKGRHGWWPQITDKGSVYYFQIERHTVMSWQQS